MTEREPLSEARLFIDWCPECGAQVRAFGGWHSLDDGGLIPQSATEHRTERIEVVPKAAS